MSNTRTIHQLIGRDDRPALDRDALVLAGKTIIQALGRSPDEQGLRGTAERFADAWLELMGEGEPDHQATTFEEPTWNQAVIVTGIEAWSVCEHHLMPFRLKVAVAYYPDGKVVGLSKFPRIVRAIARNLMVQERIVEEIAQAISSLAATQDVAVWAEGWHSCMAIRGPACNATTTTSKLAGDFSDDESSRERFFEAIRQQGNRR